MDLVRLLLERGAAVNAATRVSLNLREFRKWDSLWRKCDEIVRRMTVKCLLEFVERKHLAPHWLSSRPNRHRQDFDRK